MDGYWGMVRLLKQVAATGRREGSGVCACVRVCVCACVRVCVCW